MKYYWAVADYAQSTADSKTLKSLAGKNCAFCQGGIKYVDRLRAKGGVVRSKPHQVKVTKSQLGRFGEEVDFANVTFELVVPKSIEFYGTGNNRNRRYPGGRHALMFVLGWEPGVMSWHVRQVIEG